MVLLTLWQTIKNIIELGENLASTTIDDYFHVIQRARLCGLINNYCDPKFKNIFKIYDSNLVYLWIDILLGRQEFINSNTSSHNKPHAVLQNLQHISDEFKDN